MFKFSPLFVLLLAGLSSASPVVETSGGPPEAGSVCRPIGLVSTVNFFIQSSDNASMVWQAEQVTGTNFAFVDLVAKTNASAGTQPRDNQLWAVEAVNNGNTIALVSAGPAAEVCANGDGGPLDSLACPFVFSAGQANQSAQFFITCESCAEDNLSATRCQIQSANEGQCASFLDELNNVIKLDDCSSFQPHQIDKMFKLSPFFIALLAGLTCASPVIETRGPPETTPDSCNPVELDSNGNFFIQSHGNSSLVWQAEDVTSTAFGFVDVVTKTTSGTNQLWSLRDVNNGNFAFVISASGTTGSDVCINGQAGPFESELCPLVSTGQANQTAQVPYSQLFLEPLTHRFFFNLVLHIL
ncbi:hypothetical protein Clacol_009350 [Clathrus columnatus]|uniref:Ricin B lectin domain-containing protein n=1 Tax=Clathrus columnatus TaxID=1419009 RepID=A0AAV5AKY3_9AGAM|nr:hypothetical protein Clacol_009350 [Clathrus columnatus]